MSFNIPSRLAERVLRNKRLEPRSQFDIPLYPRIGLRRYPFAQMLVGDHFFVEAEGRPLEKVQNSVSSCVANFQRKTSQKFHQRRYSNGIRVWRVQ